LVAKGHYRNVTERLRQDNGARQWQLSRDLVLQEAQNVFVTRLHSRYDSDTFPEDLVFQETGDRQNYQGRYVIPHPWKGEPTCDVSQYQAELRKRQKREA
jgi:hypothetical protein